MSMCVTVCEELNDDDDDENVYPMLQAILGSELRVMVRSLRTVNSKLHVVFKEVLLENQCRQ